MAFSLGIGGSLATRLARARSRKWPDAAEIDRLRVHLGAEIIARPDWLPEIARPPEARARNRRGRIVHMVGMDFPAADLVAREVAAGWLPVVCTPAQASIADDPALRDGAFLLDEHGGKANRILFAGLDRAMVPLDLLLTLEATLHARALERLGCDVIHAVYDREDAGPVLVGMALARRFHVPLVGELPVKVVESRWSLFGSGRNSGAPIEDRIIAEAGAIIVPDQATRDAVVAKGAEAENVFMPDEKRLAGTISGASIPVYEHARAVYRRRHPSP